MQRESLGAKEQPEREELSEWSRNGGIRAHSELRRGGGGKNPEKTDFWESTPRAPIKTVP